MTVFDKRQSVIHMKIHLLHYLITQELIADVGICTRLAHEGTLPHFIKDEGVAREVPSFPETLFVVRGC